MASMTRAGRLVLAGATALALSATVAPSASASVADSPTSVSTTSWQAPAPAVQATSGVVGTAASLVGVPYAWGGASPAGFDCSGFTQYVYAANGMSIPRNTNTQRAATRWVSRSEAAPGDLVFFHQGAQVTHVAIYVGNNTVLHAPRTGRTVSYEGIWTTSGVTFGRL